MARPKSGPGTFALQVGAWCEKAKAREDLVVQKVVIALDASVIQMSPVGNPELWAANEHAVTFNRGAADVNAELRLNPSNLTRAGRLKRGRKIKLRSLPAGKGYVGGRFKGNWQVTVNKQPAGETGLIDPGGAKALAAGAAAAQGIKAGDVIYIQNNVPYAIPLEYGWSKQAPAGMVRVTVARFQHLVDQSVREARAELP